MDKLKEQFSGSDLAERMWADGLTYIKTVVDTAVDPFLILDKDLFVCSANKSFYQFFQVEPKDTECKYLNELGNGEWNIPKLEGLIKGILSKNTHFAGFEVDREFPGIGRKVMLLNARRIYKEGETSSLFPPIILLAMVDITEVTLIAAQLADHVSQIEIQINERTQKLETEVERLKKDVGELK